MRRGLVDPPTKEELASLNSWPEGTVGHIQEQKLLDALLLFCGHFGFGRVPQLCAQIEDIWRNPEKVELYAQMRQKRLDLLESDKKWLENWEMAKKHLLAYIAVLNVESVNEELTDEEKLVAFDPENQLGCLIFACEALDKLTDDEAAASLRDLIREREQVNHIKPHGDEELVEISERCARACLDYLRC